MSKVKVINKVISADELKLFKFLKIDRRNIKYLKYDMFYATNPSFFNDPYDSLTIYDEDKIKEYIDSKVANFFSGNGKKIIVSYSPEELASFVIKFINPSPSFMNKDFYLSCFSSTVDQGIMWGLYANSSRGVAVEYNPLDLIELYKSYTSNLVKHYMKNVFCGSDDILEEVVDDGIIEVKYISKRFNITDLYIKMVDAYFEYLTQNKTNDIKGCYNNDITLNALLSVYGYENLIDAVKTSFCYKNKEWSYEKEYRFSFIVPPFFSKGKSHVCIDSVKPVAYYLGDRISDKDKKTVVALAKKKHIKVFQMELRNNGTNYKLVPVLLFDFGSL